jgi:sugar phosphate isomerase/epimerase
MYSALSPGAIGVAAPTIEDAIAAARQGGFAGVEVNVRELAERVAREGAGALRALFDGSGVRPAAFGLPVDWHGSEEAWRRDLRALPDLARAAASVGCTRTNMWIMPASDDLTYAENRRFHLERLGPVASALGEHGVRFGLEFIGPKTLRDGKRHEFVYTLEGMLDLAAEIGPNVGLLLDCWHWYTSHGTLEALRALTPEQIVYVHVNDAPAGVPIDDQVDNVRALPGETGVIPIADFLAALDRIGYDGPVVPEPFKASLRDLPSDAERLRVVGDSMRKIMSAISR